MKTSVSTLDGNNCFTPTTASLMTEHLHRAATNDVLIASPDSTISFIHFEHSMIRLGVFRDQYLGEILVLCLPKCSRLLRKCVYSILKCFRSMLLLNEVCLEHVHEFWFVNKHYHVVIPNLVRGNLPQIVCTIPEYGGPYSCIVQTRTAHVISKLRGCR